MSVDVLINNVTKRYGDFTAIEDMSFKINKGEFFTLLGPSGCGKTTLLRMIAGFNTIEGGDILFDTTNINKLPAHKRDIGMVFQNYAIFPHLSTYDNVAYGLKARKVPKDEAHKRIMDALKVVQIEQLKDRMPHELSGGQQQRVALARAIVIEPKILLMDEPLSNLDAKLRVQMRSTIKKLQSKLGITTIYVTHDQEEALAISDRIAVMNLGKVMQIGSPDEVYRRPSNDFVADFIGTSNFLEGKIISSENGSMIIDVMDYQFTVQFDKNHQGDVLLSVRPEHFFFSEESKGIKGEIILSTFLGDFINYEIQLPNGDILEVNEYTEKVGKIRNNGPVTLQINEKSVSIFTRDGKERLVR
ncbi:MAG: polyamine ABC transporter ATP-binding protein [Firmicutes bacterium HGW-Firmicutes-20]|jgi:iron(III) transport system ATP-binding protein|nr:MAG: polyamine ABC transporter ATP-binding protein [Firmicutes bacterium HGW-Firmicutes-20]PKM69591.1 MAG: polyamine ABC transporter ATP-binding protein [Firmicutes bacterium HGW-Firmicutes-19]